MWLKIKIMLDCVFNHIFDNLNTDKFHEKRVTTWLSYIHSLPWSRVHLVGGCHLVLAKGAPQRYSSSSQCNEKLLSSTLKCVFISFHTQHFFPFVIQFRLSIFCFRPLPSNDNIIFQKWYVYGKPKNPFLQEDRKAMDWFPVGPDFEDCKRVSIILN